NLLKCDLLTVAAPPVSGVAIHLLLRDELRQTMRYVRRAASRDGRLRTSIQINRPNILTFYIPNRLAIGRELRVGRLLPALNRQLGHGLVRPPHEIQLARQRYKNLRSIRRKLITHQAPTTFTSALAASLLFRRQRFLGTL